MSKPDSRLLPIQKDNVSFFFNTLCKMRTKEHIVFPPIKAPSSLFIQSVGHENLTRLIVHHHSLFRQMAAVNFYQKEYQTIMDEVTKAAHFMMEALGCGKIYTMEYGLDGMLNGQKPFLMDEQTREIWLKLYINTLRDFSFPKKILAEFWNWIELFSLRMLNTASLKHLPKRFSFESIKREFEEDLK